MMKQPPKLRKDQLVHPKDEAPALPEGYGEKDRPKFTTSAKHGEATAEYRKSKGEYFGSRVSSSESTNQLTGPKNRNKTVVSRPVNPNSQPPVMPCALSRRQEKMLHKK